MRVVADGGEIRVLRRDEVEKYGTEFRRMREIDLGSCLESSSFLSTGNDYDELVWRCVVEWKSERVLALDYGLMGLTRVTENSARAATAGALALQVLLLNDVRPTRRRFGTAMGDCCGLRAILELG